MDNRVPDTERYRQELMKLYSRSASRGEDEKLPEEVNEEAPDDTAYSEFTDSTEQEDYNSRYPEPDLSELDTDFGTASTEDAEPPEYDSNDLIGTDRGYILVNVRTGDDSSAVEGASVEVTAVVDGKRLILASGATDSSGVSPRFSM